MTRRRLAMTDTQSWAKGVAAIALGALAMYWLDSAQGRRRRALALDQLRAARHRFGDVAMKKSRHLRNRAHGLVAEGAALLRRRNPLRDVVPAERLH